MSDLIEQAHMDAVDKLYLQPTERASKVWHILNAAVGDRTDVSKWDILCFSVEFVGNLAMAFEDEDFLSRAVHLSRWLYAVHYSNPRRLYGDPDRTTPKKADMKEAPNFQKQSEAAAKMGLPDLNGKDPSELLNQFMEFLKQREAARNAEATTQDGATSPVLDQEHRPDEVHARGEAGGHEGEGGGGG